MRLASSLFKKQPPPRHTVRTPICSPPAQPIRPAHRPGPDETRPQQRVRHLNRWTFQEAGPAEDGCRVVPWPACSRRAQPMVVAFCSNQACCLLLQRYRGFGLMGLAHAEAQGASGGIKPAPGAVGGWAIDVALQHALHHAGQRLHLPVAQTVSLPHGCGPAHAARRPPCARVRALPRHPRAKLSGHRWPRRRQLF